MLRSLVPLALILAGVGAYRTAQQPPKSALIYRNDCPHEPPCAESLWVAGQRLTTYARLNDKSGRSFAITRGQRIGFDSGVIVVERPGRILITKTDGRYRAGDTVYVLGYEGEGEYRGWHQDSALTLSFPFDDSTYGRVLERTRFTWWAQVSDNTGRRAWLALENVTDDGIAFDEAIEMRPASHRR